MTICDSAFNALLARIAAAAQQQKSPVRLLAVSKTQTAAAVRGCAAQGQVAFGENYVQEALAKQRELADLDLEWHMIGPLQSNKCREVATHFSWLQSLDRLKLVGALARARPATLAPLNVLIQVNIDDESSKSGCAPADVAELAAAIVQQSRLSLRGLMAIPAPSPERELRTVAFLRMAELFRLLKDTYPQVDTLSMGMSDDLELAIQAGATMVRVGSALFGARH